MPFERIFNPKYISRTALSKLGFVILLSLPVVAYVFKFSLLYRHGIFLGEDWDYFAQSYEAARQSILHYHQFPWWNPWMNGGQPLFANPQFGLFSIPMPLVLIFGTVAGLHYAMFVYFIVGFWGMYLLLRRTGCSSRLISALLSYLWIFSGFTAWHLGGGHLSFVVYLLAPWAFLTLLNVHKRYGWVWFTLVVSLIIHTAPHYLAIETLIICLVIAVVQLSSIMRSKNFKSFRELLPVLRPYLFAGAAIVILCGVKLFYTFQFSHEYPRPQPLDPPVSLKLFTAALTFRHMVDPANLTATSITADYGWGEYANYLGIITLGLFSYLLIRKLERMKQVSKKEYDT